MYVKRTQDLTLPWFLKALPEPLYLNPLPLKRFGALALPWEGENPMPVRHGLGETGTDRENLSVAGLGCGWKKQHPWQEPTDSKTRQ